MDTNEERERWLNRDFSEKMRQMQEAEVSEDYVETRFGRARVVPGFHVDEEGFVIPDDDPEDPFGEGYKPAEGFEAAEDAAFGEEADEDIDDGAPEELGEPEEEPVPAELTFEEKLEKLRYTVHNHPTLREIFRKILVYCETERTFSDLEERIATYPEFKHAGQTQFNLIDQLLFSYGLDMLEYGEEGEPITPEMKEGLTEDEADDLVWSYGIITTDVGSTLAKEMEPERRITDILKEVPLRHDAYIELLDFCGSEPRTYKEIYDLFHGRDVLRFSLNKTLPNMPIEPSVLVDKMERAGALVWDDGWKLTREGRRYLEGIIKAAQ